MANRSKHGADIHRRLADGQPVGHIANETGLTESQIHRHKRGACKCSAGSPASATRSVAAIPVEARTVDGIDPWKPLPWAPTGSLIRWAFVAGMSADWIRESLAEDGIELTLDAVESEITPETRCELEARREKALAYVSKHNPARWLQIDDQRRERYQRAAEVEAAAVDPALLGIFLKDIIARQRDFLTSDDFLHWLRWMRELVGYRYPQLQPALDMALDEARETA